MADVKRWLQAAKLDHRLDEVAAIAHEAVQIAEQLQAQSAPAPSQAEEAFRANIQEGTTASNTALREMDELALTQRISQMSVKEFGAERERLGLQKSVFDHLAGL